MGQLPWPALPDLGLTSHPTAQAQQRTIITAGASMTDLLDEGHHLVVALERGIHQLRAHLNQHSWREQAMALIDDVITKYHDLKADRATIATDRDAQKARADKAEADLKALQDQQAADDAKLQAVLAESDAGTDGGSQAGADIGAGSQPTDVDPATGLPRA